MSKRQAAISTSTYADEMTATITATEEANVHGTCYVHLVYSFRGLLHSGATTAAIIQVVLVYEKAFADCFSQCQKR
jgi:hypothetical protein